MRNSLLWVGLLVLLGGGSVQAASYLDNAGVTHNPIRTNDGDVHSYSGANLLPSASLLLAQLANANLNNANLDYADLGSADLLGANLASAHLVGANLSSASLVLAKLNGANLQSADLSSASLSSSQLLGADFSGADLSQATLSFTSLKSLDLSDADLSGANLTQAYWLNDVIGTPSYDAYTDFSGAYSGDAFTSTAFDPVGAGWNLIPEPSTAVLVATGLAGLTMRRRRTRTPCHS